MIVDCMTCPAHAQRCVDCVVTVLRSPGSQKHPVWPDQTTSDELPLSEELRLWGEVPLSEELQLDAAESRVVSMFVSVGLVKAGAAAGIRARQQTVPPWTAVRDAG